MTLPFASKPPERRLLAESPVAGPMPWVLAIMVFLTVLAGAGTLALAAAVGALGHQVAGGATIQIVEADRPGREAQTAAAISAAKAVAGVRNVVRVPDAELSRLIEPWLGPAEQALPQPTMIDVELAGPQSLPSLRAAVMRVAPSARIDGHASWLAPITDLLGALQGLAIALILLMGVATGASVVLAARAALNTHRETIDVLHLLGATDLQIARLFQRRLALDAMVGGALGFVGGAAVLLMLRGQVSALGSGLAESARLGSTGWLALLLAPVGVALLATLVARLTVQRALRVIL
jgi:cell division transport system permease protein